MEVSLLQELGVYEKACWRRVEGGGNGKKGGARNIALGRFVAGNRERDEHVFH